jgi:hypothetical protein
LVTPCKDGSFEHTLNQKEPNPLGQGACVMETNGIAINSWRYFKQNNDVKPLQPLYNEFKDNKTVAVR